MKLDNISSPKKIDTRILDVYVSDNVISNYEILEIKNDNTYVDIFTDGTSDYKKDMFTKMRKYNIYVNRHVNQPFVVYYYNMKETTLKNFPKIYDSARLIIKNCENLIDITDIPRLSNNIMAVVFDGCTALEDFTGLTDVSIDGVELRISISLRSTNIKNLSTLKTKNVISINMVSTRNFDSYKNISEYKNLETIDYFQYDKNDIKMEISHSIELLLCHSLKSIEFRDKHDMLEIVDKYVRMGLQKRKEHIMDCAIELIDAGYEKAAEL